MKTQNKNISTVYESIKTYRNAHITLLEDLKEYEIISSEHCQKMIEELKQDVFNIIDKIMDHKE